MMRGNLSGSRWPFTIASMMLGWSEPRLTKQWVTPASQMASKKANDVVYILGEFVDKGLLDPGVCCLNWQEPISITVAKREVIHNCSSSSNSQTH